MDMISFNLERTRSLMTEIVAKRGWNFIYEEPYGSPICRYVHGDVPGCAVGEFLHLAGIPIERLREADEVAESADDLLEKLQKEGYMSSDELSRLYLYNFQLLQDSRWSWGTCLESSDRRYPEVI
jgi:hypothetical protein